MIRLFVKTASEAFCKEAGEVSTKTVTRNGVRYTVKTIRGDKLSEVAKENFNRKLEEATEKRLSEEAGKN
jgi:hypothetical protein